MTLISNNHLAEVTKPGEEALHFPPSLVSPQLPPILGLGLSSVASVRSYHVDAHLLQRGVKWVRVISLVSHSHSHEPLWSAFNMGCLESVVHKGDFMWRSTFNVYGEWKRRAVCNCHDLRTLTPLGLSNTEPPFFATTKVPSMKHSDKSMSPRSSKSVATACSTRSRTPERTHSWKRRWQVWYGGYLSGRSAHCAPVLRIHKIPSSTSLGWRRGLPLPSSRRDASGISGSSTCHCSSVRFNFATPEKDAFLSVAHS